MSGRKLPFDDSPERYAPIVGSTLRELESKKENRRKAARRIASSALNAQDCALLLDVLGLTAEEGRTP